MKNPNISLTGFKKGVHFIVLIIALLSVVCSNNGYAQLTFNNALTAQQLAQILAGPGVTVSNATMNCPFNAIGSFNGSSNIGMLSGIILTTGSTANAAGPNNTGSAGTNNGAPGDPQLNTLAGSGTFDACALEFDIVPVCSLLSFNYVFGSEEYPEWVNSSFNDAFAFFISGPGIVGQQNIALVPLTALPVTIDNINATTNSIYYVDNTGGATIQYDAFTVVLTASITVQPCQTYHLKIVIADAGDGIYDSGVFLEEGSMQCPSVAATATVANAIEGCQNGLITFCRPQADPSPQTVSFTIAGTAINGTDYNTISNSITIPANQTCITLTIVPIDDGITEPVETIMIIYQPAPCAPNDTAIVTITDGLSISVAPLSPLICPGGNVVLTASGAITYTWSPSTGLNTTTGASVIASPAATTTYTVTGSDGICTASQTVTVTVSPCMILTTIKTNVICNGACNGSATVTASGGVVPYTYLWSPSGNTGAAALNLCPGVHTVTVTDNSGFSDTASVTITEPPPITVALTAIDISCNGICDGSISALPANGTAPYTYLWSPTGGSGSAATGLCAGTYTVTVTDVNGCIGTGSAVINEPSAITLLVNTTDANCGQSNGQATVIPSGGIGPYTYSWLLSGNTSATDINLSAAGSPYPVTVTDVNGCSVTGFAVIGDITGPTAIISGSIDVSCNGGNDGQAAVAVTDGIPPYTFMWVPSGQITPTATGLFAGSYTVTVTDAANCVSTVNVIINQPPLLTAAISSSSDANCFSACDGFATVLAGGGTPPLYLFMEHYPCSNYCRCHRLMCRDIHCCCY